jgi:ankyrin repeat protein
MDVLRWAISNRCPELIEDMWSSERIRSLVAGVRQENSAANEPALLAWAVDQKVDEETLETLLDWPGLDLSLHDEGLNALISASKRGNHVAVDLLLQRGVRPHGSGTKALFLAVRERHRRVVLRLLSEGTGQAEATYLTAALHSAIEWDNDIVKLLLEHRADPNAPGVGGRTALNVATRKGNTAAVKELLRHGARMEKRDNSGKYPLLLAVQLGHAAILELFIPNLSQTTIEGLLPAAVDSGHNTIVDLLLASRTAEKHEKEIPQDQTPPLIAAAEKGREIITESLLRAGANPNELLSDESNSPLHAAVKAGHDRIVSAILNPRYNANVDLRIRTGQTPLALAVELGQYKTAELLLQRKAAPDADLGEMGTVLHLAVEIKGRDMVDLLLREGADPNRKDGKGRTPLLAALDGEIIKHDPVREAIVEGLLNAGARPDEGNTDNTNAPLHAALRSGNPNIISTILDPRHKADVDLVVDTWKTPLAVAVDLGQPQSVLKLLLERGANPNAKYYQSDSAGVSNVLHLATERGHSEIVKLLIAAKADTEAKDKAGRTPLLVALECEVAQHNEDYETIVDSLLRAEANANAAVEVAGEEGRTTVTALHLAVESGNEVMVRLLTEHHVNTEVRNDEGLTPLLTIMSPCQRLTQEQREMVRILLTAGADGNATGGKYGNALQAAAHHGGEFLVYELLQHEPKIDVNAQGGHFGSALQAAAAAWAGEEVVELLLEHGADHSAPGGVYGSPLLAALMCGRKKVVEILLRRGADTEARHPASGLTALLVAVNRGDVELVSLLLQQKAKTESVDEEGRSALLLAAGTGNMRMLEVLLDGGVNKEAKEPKTHRTPLLVASERGDYDMVRLLLERGADIKAEGGIYGNVMRAALYQQNGNAEEIRQSFGGSTELKGG